MKMKNIHLPLLKEHNVLKGTCHKQLQSQNAVKIITGASKGEREVLSDSWNSKVLNFKKT